MDTENYYEIIESETVESLEIGENIEISTETPCTEQDTSQNYIFEDINNDDIQYGTDLEDINDIDCKKEPIDLSFPKTDQARNYILLQEPPIFATSSDMVVFNVPPNSVMCTSSPNMNLATTVSNRSHMVPPSPWSSTMLPHPPQSPNYLVPHNFMNHPYQQYPQPSHTPNSYHLKSRQEVLKKAKSVFLKRTRNLYHWIYPTASKHQIKKIVSNSWDSMSEGEKRIYVSHVMGTFSKNIDSNPILNPQLERIHKFSKNQPRSNSDELRNAIASITSETNKVQHVPMQPVKRGRGRPRLSAPVPTVSHQDFEDDPELSRELAKFSSVLNNQI